MKHYFKNKEDFQKYVESEKPKYIWLDDFSIETPYIYFSFIYDDGRFGGSYVGQTLLGGYNGDFTWIFEDGMYVKIQDDN